MARCDCGADLRRNLARVEGVLACTRCGRTDSALSEPLHGRVIDQIEADRWPLWRIALALVVIVAFVVGLFLWPEPPI